MSHVVEEGTHCNDLRLRRYCLCMQLDLPASRNSFGVRSTACLPFGPRSRTSSDIVKRGGLSRQRATLTCAARSDLLVPLSVFQVEHWLNKSRPRDPCSTRHEECKFPALFPANANGPRNIVVPAWRNSPCNLVNSPCFSHRLLAPIPSVSAKPASACVTQGYLGVSCSSPG